MTLQILLHLHLAAHFRTNCSTAIVQPVGKLSDHTLYVDYLQISTKYDHMYNHMYLQLANKYTAAVKHSTVPEGTHSTGIYQMSSEVISCVFFKFNILQRRIKTKTIKIQGVHGTGNKQYCLLGHDKVLYGRYQLVFYRKLQPPSLR